MTEARSAPDNDKRMTYDEWVRENQTRECAETGHDPAHRNRTLGQALGTYYCQCGRVAWTPEVRD